MLALGNADGRGGLPSTAQGTIKALNQSIEASDSGAGTTEKLNGMIQTNAPIQEGDSGGPLVNGSGQVVGMDTAANSSSSGFGGYSAATTGFAIPINTAMSIADKINVRQGVLDRAHRPGRVHGRERRRRVDPGGCRTGGDSFGGNGFTSPVNSGALICQVYPDSPASSAGMAAAT